VGAWPGCVSWVLVVMPRWIAFGVMGDQFWEMGGAFETDGLGLSTCISVD
jgi:hypothetical protein